MLRFGAIDVGSNAIRLVLSYVYEGKEEPVFQRETLLRIPIRLGEDVFAQGQIGHIKAHQLLESMCAFKQLLGVFRPAGWMACATSAMRDASNQAEILKEIRDVAELDLQVLSGQEEAALIFANHIAETLSPGGTYLYIDIGGGSTELSLFSGSRLIDGCSFNLGTVRSLAGGINPKVWDDLEKWIAVRRKVYPKPWQGIGSGGNLNKIQKLVGKKGKKTLEIIDLAKIHKKLLKCTYAQRMEKFGLKPDRADVILPAAEICLRIALNAHIETLHIPQMGLADGMIHDMYTKYCANHDDR
jgi:exopolyphosphatase/guanosine-5'-triphosphate,3'-diphosphate pyrophosphatase